MGSILLLFIFVGFVYQGLSGGSSFSFTARLGSSVSFFTIALDLKVLVL